jgi:hypothetical protein
MRNIKSLKNLRYKLYDSEVFHCGSMGIYADFISPKPPWRRAVWETKESRVKIFPDLEASIWEVCFLA